MRSRNVGQLLVCEDWSHPVTAPDIIITIIHSSLSSRNTCSTMSSQQRTKSTHSDIHLRNVGQLIGLLHFSDQNALDLIELESGIDRPFLIH